MLDGIVLTMIHWMIHWMMTSMICQRVISQTLRSSEIQISSTQGYEDWYVKISTKIDRNLAHDQWGHNNRKRDKCFAKLLGYELIGDKIKCNACRIAKPKRANVSKTTSVKTTKPGEHVYVNTSGPFKGDEDHYSDKCMMQFSPAKKHMTQFVEQALIALFKGKDKPIKYVKMDGGGENEGMKKLCLKNGAMLEKNPPYTSQYNGKIDRRHSTIDCMLCYDLAVKCEICKDC